MQRILFILFLLGAGFLFSHAYAQEAGAGSPIDETEVPPTAIVGANDYLAELFPLEYIAAKISFAYILAHAGEEYEFVYAYDVPYTQGSDNQVRLRVQGDGTLVSYAGPEEPYAFVLSELDAKAVALENGMTAISSAYIAYGKNGLASDAGTLNESYVWVLTNTSAEEATPATLYVEVDSGEVLGMQTQPGASVSPPEEEEEDTIIVTTPPEPVMISSEDWYSLVAAGLIFIAAAIFLFFRQK